MHLTATVCLPHRSKGAKDDLGLSEATWETLEVLVMDPKQALVASESLSTLQAEKQETVHLSIRGLGPGALLLLGNGMMVTEA